MNEPSPSAVEVLAILVAAKKPLPREEITRRGGNTRLLPYLRRVGMVQADPFFVDGRSVVLWRPVAH